MNDTTQTVIVIAIITLAVAFFLKRIFSLKRGCDCGCDGCDGRNNRNGCHTCNCKKQ